MRASTRLGRVLSDAVSIGLGLLAQRLGIGGVVFADEHEARLLHHQRAFRLDHTSNRVHQRVTRSLRRRHLVASTRHETVTESAGISSHQVESG